MKNFTKTNTSCAFANDKSFTNNFRILYLLREVHDKMNLKYPLKVIENVQKFVMATKDHFLKSMSKEVLIRAWNQGATANKQIEIINDLVDRDRIAGLRII